MFPFAQISFATGQTAAHITSAVVIIIISPMDVESIRLLYYVILILHRARR